MNKRKIAVGYSVTVFHIIILGSLLERINLLSEIFSFPLRLISENIDLEWHEIIVITLLISIYAAKSSVSFPKRQRYLFSAITSCMLLLLMKSVTWFFHDCCGLRLLFLLCGVLWQIFGQRLSSIIR